MNAFCGPILIFLALFLTHVGGYTFRENRDVYFALSNSEMSMEELKQRENRLFLENAEKLTVFCQLVDKQNWSIARSEELTKKYIFSGLHPYITFRNKTWWTTYKFQTKETNSNSRWWFEIERSTFTPGINDVLFEPWFIKVELGYGLGLYETKGILIAKEPLVNLAQSLGKIVDKSFVMNRSNEQFVMKPAPCCGDILFILPFKNKSVSCVGGCYIGVTYGAFSPQTTIWLNVCENENINASLCSVFSSEDCNNLILLDMVVTRNHIVFATTFGLVKSASFSLLITEHSILEKVYVEISSPPKLLSLFTSGNIKLQYTSYCLDFHVYGYNNDLIYVLSTGSTNAVYRSQSPYTQFLELVLSKPFNNVKVLGIVNDVTKSSEVFLINISLNQAERYVVLVVSKDSNRHYVFPPWYFSENSMATEIKFHTWSNTILVYGSEVWKSRDGGNSFEQLTELRRHHVITALSFPQYGDNIIALTNYGNILKGRIGISRLIATHHQFLSSPLDFILIDELETMKGFSPSGNNSVFGRYSIEKIHFESYQKHFCTDHLLLQFIGHQDVFMFVVAPYEQFSNQSLSSYCFSSFTVRQVLQSRLGGSAHISEIMQLEPSSGYYTRAKGEVVEDFVGLTVISAPVLKMDLQLRIFNSTFYKVIYEIKITGETWSVHDVGRTVVLSNGMSILLIKYIDVFTIYGLPSPGFSPNILPYAKQKAGTWQLYDLSSATVIFHAVNALSMSYSQGEFKATTNFAFTSSHLGKVLLIHSDNHGVIKTVSGGIVSFQNSSLLKEGNFSEWKLLEPRVYTSEPKNGYGMWWLEEEDCSNFPIVTPKVYKTLYHLDVQDNVTLQFAVLIRHLGKTEPQISMHVSNPSLFFIRRTRYHHKTNHTLDVSLLRKPGTTGLSQMSFSVPYLSLKCPSVSNVLTIHGGCPPSKRLVFEYPITFTPNVFLYGTPKDSDGVLRHYKLPANYRPPSSRGVSIPMSSNLYNVHPEKPPYKERFAISRETRVYKQCSGQSYRRDCACGQENITMSRLVAYSDCITTVYRLLYGEVFRPNFTLLQDDTITKRFVDPYYIVELNQRSDFKIIRGTALRITGHDSIIVALQNQLNSSVEFTGGGLYHFRAYAVKEGYTLCDLTDEFIVFIDDLPLPNPARDVVRFTTAMLFVSASFLSYLWYLYYSDQRDQNRVFPD